MTTAQKITEMQRKPTARLSGPTQMPDGTWRHPCDANSFESESICRADYRFAREWGYR
jgi:hypothetical protein